MPPRPTALIADDHHLSRLALSGVLTGRLGFGSVLEAGDLDGALSLLGTAGPVDLALFDLDMPGMAGAGSLSVVRHVFPKVRLVVVSGSTGRGHILRALEAGVHGFVPKTLRVDEIAAVLGRILAGELYVPPSLAVLPRPPDSEEGGALRLSGAARPVSPAPPGDGGEVLTGRQLEILDLLRQGKSNKEIARALHLAAGTVKVHVSSVLRSLGAPNRAAAAAAAATIAGRQAAKPDAGAA